MSVIEKDINKYQRTNYEKNKTKKKQINEEVIKLTN